MKIEGSLKPLLRDYKKQRPNSGLAHLKFHHDNARPHVAQRVIAFLEGKKVTLMEHPPDLAPSDFWLFDYRKFRLSDQPDAQKLCKAITKIVENIPRSKFLKTFQKWQERM